MGERYLKTSLLLVSLAASLAIILSACGTGATPTPTAAPAATPVEPGIAGSPTPVPEPTEPDFDAEAHFRGQTIRVSIPFAAGGGTDLEARFLAAHLPQFVPGRPRVIVSNVPPQTALMNRMFHNVAADGLTIAHTSGNRTVEQFTDPVADFKFDEFRFIMTYGSPAGITFVSQDAPYTRLQDCAGNPGGAPLRGMIDGPETVNGMLWAAASELLDCPIEFIIGTAGGTAPLYLAFDRGEINMIPRFGGILWYTAPTQRPGYVRDGTFEPFMVGLPRGMRPGPNREAQLPDDVLNVVEFMEQVGVDPTELELFELLIGVDSHFGKMILTAPGTPDAIVNELRRAYTDLLNDPALNAEMERLQGQPVEITPGDQIEETLRRHQEFGRRLAEYDKYIQWADERLR